MTQCTLDRRLGKHCLVWPEEAWDEGTLKDIKDFWYLRVDFPSEEYASKLRYLIDRINPPTEVVAKEVYIALLQADALGRLSENDTPKKRLGLLIKLFQGRSTRTERSLIEERMAVKILGSLG